MNFAGGVSKSNQYSSSEQYIVRTTNQNYIWAFDLVKWNPLQLVNLELRLSLPQMADRMPLIPETAFLSHSSPNPVIGMRDYS